MELKTPLYEEHVKAGGRIVDFAGWSLPVQYQTGIIKEHMAVRTSCGLFDVSHMGELHLHAAAGASGTPAQDSLNHLLTNDYTGMEDGQSRYSPMCNEQGGVVDDLIVYRKSSEDYLIVVNAANKDKDFEWMRAHLLPGAELEDVSADWAQLALQGPKAEEILRRLTEADNIPGAYYTAKFDRTVAGIPAIIARTGYTGEDGFELYVAPAEAPRLWETLLETGKDDGLIPCGLGARDTLRLEAGMPLYGHEMNDEISPLEARLGIFVKMDKPEFIGKEALVSRGTPAVLRAGLVVTGRGIVRENEPVFAGDATVGRTTSGTKGPFVNKPIAMALLGREYTEPGTKLEVEVRGRRIPVEVVKLPFYKRKK